MKITKLWKQISEVGLDKVANNENQQHMMTINQTLMVLILVCFSYNLGYLAYDPQLFMGPILINCLSFVGYVFCFFWSRQGSYRGASLQFTFIGLTQIIALTHQLSSASGVNIWLVSVGTTIFLFLPRKDKFLIFLLPFLSFLSYVGSQLAFRESAIQQAAPSWLMTGFFVCNLACAIFIGSLVAYFFQTALFRTQDELIETKIDVERANNTKDKFFSIIAHDLRGPIGSLSVIFNDMETAADIEDDLFMAIRSTTKNTHQLLENLLTWANSQKGEIEFYPCDFSIATAVQNNIELFQGTAKQKEIALTSDLDSNQFVYADLEMVTTVVRNLLNNAIKFTPLGGKISISTKLQDQMLQISVIDSGVGISAANQESLFLLEQKGQSSLGTNKEAGSGLGLILCAEFIKKQGGQIGVSSMVGKGSQFWFTVPLGKEATRQPVMDEEKVLAHLSKMQVLVVDDDDLHKETSMMVLKNLGMDFVMAKNGKEALDLSQTQRFDFILMDIDMPIMNGVEATKAIRQKSENQLILALTSYSPIDLNHLSHGVTFDGYLNKPLKREKLLAKLQPHLFNS